MISKEIGILDFRFKNFDTVKIFYSIWKCYVIKEGKILINM